eukprot:234587-Rhodomonas_salina.1
MKRGRARGRGSERSGVAVCVWAGRCVDAGADDAPGLAAVAAALCAAEAEPQPPAGLRTHASHQLDRQERHLRRLCRPQ